MARPRGWWHILEQTGVYALLLVASAFTLFPLLWGLSTSFKTPEKLISYPPEWLPFPISFENYTQVLFHSNMLRYYWNSILVTGVTIVFCLGIGTLGGYGAARLQFRGKKAVLFLLLATVMIPGIVVLVPLYMLANKAGLHNTHLAIILVFAGWQVPTVIWMMRGFFESIPRALEEAAQIDGCSPMQALRLVILPLCRPGLAAAAIVVFVWVWNEFVINLTLTASDDMRLIPGGLYMYISNFGIEWGRLMAAVYLALIPVIILFVVLQKHLIHGLTAGGTKG